MDLVVKFMVYGWFMDGLWMVYGWFMDGFWFSGFEQTSWIQQWGKGFANGNLVALRPEKYVATCDWELGFQHVATVQLGPG